MLLGLIPMFCFGILRIYGGNRKKKGKLENMGIIGLLRHSVGNPRRGVDLCQGMEYLIAARLRCQNGTPQVHHGVALLLRSIATVNNKQILDFCFRTPRIRTPIV